MRTVLGVFVAALVAMMVVTMMQGDTEIVSSGEGQSGQSAAAPTGGAAGGGAGAQECVPGSGTLPAPGAYRKDSVVNPPTKIPANMKALYVAAGKKYGLPWELLAGVGMSETSHGRNKNTSDKGAQGPMQFMPGTWQGYGVDGDGDGRKDVTNAADAIPAAANYLRASGAPGDVRKALFAYNRADWYVNDVLFYAQHYGAEPCVAAGSGPVAGIGQCPPTKHAAERGLKTSALRGLRCGAEQAPWVKEIGGVGPRPNASDHSSGRAIDFMVPNYKDAAQRAKGQALADWYAANAAKLDVKYVIFYDRIWSASRGAWKAYTHPNGSSTDTLAHRDHVHVSFNN